ncbi:hypothetical protein ACF0H5_013261 [Mactra antiquata]
MESTDLDMGEIFDDDGNDDDDIGALGVLPDLEDTQPQDTEDQENAEVLARLKDLSKGAAKKVVRKPQPKLDPTRLTGERGIPVLPKLFENTKFKGKGHEAQDLALIMRQMEHWAHRLFPKMPFDECIERVEKLGGKKEVQTCIKKIRLDMPVLDNDFVGSEPDDDDDDVVRNGDDMNDDRRDVPSKTAEDVWDELLREEEELTTSQIQNGKHTPSKTSTPYTDPSTPAPNSVTQSDNTSKDTTVAGGMTPAQIERMERNKQLAMERRLKKLGKFTPGKLPFSSQNTNTAQVSQEKSQTSSNIQENTNITSQEMKETNEAGSQNDNSDTKDNSIDNAVNDVIADEFDDEMTEAIEKVIDQDIVLDENLAKNAQDWNTLGNGTTSGVTGESVNNTEGSVAMETEHDEAESGSQLTNTLNGDVRLESVVETLDGVEESANIDKIDHDINVGTVNDANEMSEIIPVQDNCEIEKKCVKEDVSDSQEMSEVIKKQDGS